MSRHIDLQAIADSVGPVFAERASALDETDGFIGDNYDLLREHKVFSAMVPEELGGAGVPHSAMAAFIRTLAHSCGATALTLSMHQHLVGTAVVNHRAGRPGEKLLRKVSGGETILVSTGANDWLESNGSAKRVGGGYRVTAIKPFASGSPKGDMIVTSVVHDDPRDGAQVLHFAAPLSADGVTVGDDWKTLGMRATGSQTVRLDGVFVADDAIVLRRPRGAYHLAFSVILTVAMPLIMSAYVGVAEAAAAIARERAAKRSRNPVTPYLIGEMENLLATAQIACDDMVRIANDFDFAPTVETANAILIRKTVAAKHVIAAAEKAVEATGGAGFFRKVGLERLLRDVHGGQFHPLPEKRQQLFSGRLAMGLEPIASAVPQPARAAAA